MFYYQSPTSNFYNEIWYKNTYNLPGDNLLHHYCTIGHKLNYNPSLYFDTKWYKSNYNLDENTNPLEHFCSNINIKPNEKCKYFIKNPTAWTKDWVNIKGDFIPLQNEKKKINLLLPALSLSAGPQTIYIFANMLAERGHNVRIISLYAPLDSEFKNEIVKRIEFNKNIELESQFNKDIIISYDDIFIASAWWTVYPLKFILGYLKFKKFFWFIQENELLLHCGDETYAKALECYNMDYYSFINTSILKDDLVKINFKTLDGICFEPAFDRKLFYYQFKQDRSKIQIIFYSRDDTVAVRNLVRLVHQLLLEAYNNNIINENNCVIYGFGQNKGKHCISDNFYYEDLGFLEIDSYSKLMRDSDILISFQMAPHPSYPPLEMSHCNGVCLHTNFSNKTNKTMSRYSDKVILADPSINSLLEGLENCITLIKNNNISSEFPKLLNDNWNTALADCYDLFIKHI